MYDDNYRKRFTTVSAAIYSDEIKQFNGKKTLQCTHKHNHYDFEILIIKSGKARFNVGASSFDATGGDVILINPYEVHSAEALSEGSDYSYFCITFDAALLASRGAYSLTEICEKTTAGYMKFNHIIRNSEISTLVMEAEKAFLKNTKGRDFFITSKLLDIFGHLLNNDEYIILPELPKKHSFSKEVYEYIQENLNENITSASASKKLCYNNSYFCRLFRKNFGQSFGEYVNFQRVNYANELLRKGYSVSEAAFSSGFNNLSYFTKVFKNYMGVLPSKITGLPEIRKGL